MASTSEKTGCAAECDHDPEQRGPNVFLAGLCCTCGRTTTERDRDGLPRHRPRQAAATGTCAVCREPMTIYEAGQAAHPAC